MEKIVFSSENMKENKKGGKMEIKIINKNKTKENYLVKKFKISDNMINLFFEDNTKKILFLSHIKNIRG